MIANLRFTEEKLGDMETLSFEEEHQVEGSESWLVGKFGEWLRVDFRKPKHAGVWHPKQGIVLTKRDVDDREASSNVVCESGTLVPHPSQAMVVGGDHGKSACVEDTKTKNTKRTYVRKDNDGSFVTKKAHSVMDLIGAMLMMDKRTRHLKRYG
ncbi:hypothetical protein V6N13_043315 [Hibiscus sabdariffa]